MSDVAKWGLLVAAVIVVIGLVVALPFNQYIDSGAFSAGLATVLTIAGDGFVFGRGLINNFLSPWARNVFSGLLYWIIGKFLITWTIKISVWVYHYIFK